MNSPSVASIFKYFPTSRFTCSIKFSLSTRLIAPMCCRFLNLVIESDHKCNNAAKCKINRYRNFLCSKISHLNFINFRRYYLKIWKLQLHFFKWIFSCIKLKTLKLSLNLKMFENSQNLVRHASFKYPILYGQ